MLTSALEIIGYGAWNGGIRVDNSVFENSNMFFKGGIPVNSETIEERIGVRTRMAAPVDERIGVTALQDLLREPAFDPSRIKLLIGATNVGEDKYDPGPLVRHPYQLIRAAAPEALALDIYAGCPGFNVAVELIFMLTLGGILKQGDISVALGAENIHRANSFAPDDTSNIIFGDDSLATALETRTGFNPNGNYSATPENRADFGSDFVDRTAQLIFDLQGKDALDGIIVDNQSGIIEHRIPATAARVQDALVRLQHPQAAAEGRFKRFKEALAFYDGEVSSFGFDIMSLGGDPHFVEQIGKAYVCSGKYRTVASVNLHPERGISVKIHQGDGFDLPKPAFGVIDTFTQTHGCFGDFIRIVNISGENFGHIDGKGVFLYATRGAKRHISALLDGNGLGLDDIELLIEHQANFAMIPLTLEQLLKSAASDPAKAAAEFIANKMVTNIHERGNCSVVCMQRLPYDLHRDALKADSIQGYAVNQNLDALKRARLILHDSVGAGMTRSSFLLRTSNQERES